MYVCIMSALLAGVAQAMASESTGIAGECPSDAIHGDDVLLGQVPASDEAFSNTCLSKEQEAQESIGVCKPSGHALATRGERFVHPLQN